MSEEPRTISITLSPTQVDEVVRAATDSRAPSLARLIATSLRAPLEDGHDAEAPGGEHTVDPSGEDGADGRRARPAYIPSDTTDSRLSRSLLRGLSVLTCFGSGEESRGIVEMAADLDMSPSTAHRYALTLVELGLLERCPTTRKYRLPRTHF